MSKNLKTSVKIDTKGAIRSLDALQKKIKAVEDATNRQAKLKKGLNTQIQKETKLQEQVKREILKTATAEQKLTEQTHKTALAKEKLNTATKKTTDSTNVLLGKVKALAATYLGLKGMKAVLDTSDIITSSENRLNALNGDNEQHTQESLDKMYVAAQNARTGYAAMIGNASKSMTLAEDAFQGNIDNAIRFQEIMAKSYTLGGASAAEQHSSMYQMIQALGSGVLQGDELRSVREGAPLAYKAIEQFAQGVYDTDESLKELASQGKITSDMVVAGIMAAGEQIDIDFANAEMTFAQAFLGMKNTAIKAFEPVLQMLRDVLDTKLVVGLMNGITTGMIIISGALQIVFGWISKVYNFIESNWGVMSKVFMTLAAIILGYYVPAIYAAISAKLIDIAETVYLLALEAGGLIKNAYLWVQNGIAAAHSGMAAFLAWLPVNWVLYLIIAVIVAVIVALIWLSDGFVDACGIIVGVIMAAVSVIWNLFVTLLIYVIQSIILPLATAWQTFANFFGNLFVDPIGAIIHMFEGLAQAVLSILQTIAKGIDSVFGSNLASAVQGWSKSLGGKADALAAKYGNGKYSQKSDAVNKISGILADVQGKMSWSTSDAYNTGYKWGASAGNWIVDKANGVKEFINGSIPGLGDYDLTGAYNTPGMGDLGDLGKDVGNIDDNTGRAADALELTQEDLEYLRKLAAMEWKKEFTTASINVDMKNYNTMNGESDLDGIVTKLVDKLYDELDSVANGVYA